MLLCVQKKKLKKSSDEVYNYYDSTPRHKEKLYYRGENNDNNRGLYGQESNQELYGQENNQE